jgi:hypothetical protein
MTTISIIGNLREKFNDAIHTPETWARVLSAPKKASLAGEYEIPDFAAMCPGEFCDDDECVCSDAHCDSRMDAQFAFLVWSTGEFLADTYVDAQYYEDDLPPVAIRHLGRLDDQGRTTWLERFAASFLYFSDCASAGVIPSPRCTGEEMALHILLDFVSGDIQDLDDTHAEDKDFRALPETTRGLSESLSLAKDNWFEDHDVLMLFDDVLEGIESDEEIGNVMGIINLQPDSWFIPFRP